MVKPFPPSFPSNPVPLQTYQEDGNSTLFQFLNRASGGWSRKEVRLSDEFPIKRIGSNLWTPAAITTALWLDAADASTVTLNGSNVSQWNDKSGNGRHAVQNTPASQPAYTASGINSLPAIGSTGDVLQVPDFYAANLTAVVVARTPSSIDFGFYHTILRQQASDYFLRVFGNTARLETIATGTNSSTVVVTGTTTITANTNFLFGGEYGPVNIVGYTNGVQDGSSAMPGAGSLFDGAGPLYIGAGDNGTSEFWNGRIGELILFPGTPSTDTRQRCEGYLAHKWGLTANLDVGHPYKSSAPTP